MVRTVGGTILTVLGLAFGDGSAHPSAEPREIAVTVTRFTFAPARIEVAEGERVRPTVTSADGMHGFEIKKLNLRKEVAANGPAVVEFEAPTAGTYEVSCSEYCGTGHNRMKAALVVSPKTGR